MVVLPEEPAIFPFHKVANVGSAAVAAQAIRHGRGAVDVIAAFVGPDRLAAGGIDAVQLEIIAADENPDGIARFDPIGRTEDFVAGMGAEAVKKLQPRPLPVVESALV